MVALSLKISIGNVVKTMQFEPSTMVYDACRMIRERVPEAQIGQCKSMVGLAAVPGLPWLSSWHFTGLPFLFCLCLSGTFPEKVVGRGDQGPSPLAQLR